MSAALKADNKLTNIKINCYFWFRIHPDDCHDILAQLKKQDSNFDRKTVPTVQKAVEAGQVVFCDEAIDPNWDDPIAGLVSKDAKKKKRKSGKERKEVISSDEEESSGTDSESDEEGEWPKRKTV